jgi:hypothetical protein
MSQHAKEQKNEDVKNRFERNPLSGETLLQNRELF